MAMLIAPPRPATAPDAETIGTIHVEAWIESYSGVVPMRYLASLDPVEQAKRWHKRIVAGGLSIVLSGEEGFACAGPMRNADLARMGYGTELHALYVVRAAQGMGLGRDLMQAALAPYDGPFALWVLARNDKAIRFYERLGGKPIAEGRFELGGEMLDEHAFGWEDTSGILN
ncbi:MAG: GNAT family N-acetyltransferase [Rubricella sp.]